VKAREAGGAFRGVRVMIRILRNCTDVAAADVGTAFLDQAGV